MKKPLVEIGKQQGNTTRLVDYYVQMLFNFPNTSVKIIDHFNGITEMDHHIYNVIEKRLNSEHIGNKFIFDKNNHVIKFIPTIDNTFKPLPKYKCNKVVSAIEILKIQVNISTGGGIIYPKLFGYKSIEVNFEFMVKHKPQIGGYYIIYEDGYCSYSPKEAFENGYKIIE